MQHTVHRLLHHPLAARLALCLAGAMVLTAPARSAPTLGFVETWPGSSTQFWTSQSLVSNPGTGGLTGSGDGYLKFTTPNLTQHNLGVASHEAEFSGNWTAAGITQVRMWLNDVGADDPLEMHFSIGNFGNFWQYNVAFLPPHNQWAEFVVDLSSSTNWTQTIDPLPLETFAQALQAVDRVHLRHDKAPFVQGPDPLDGDVGLDRLLLTNGVVGVSPGGPIVPRALQLAAPAPNPSRGPVAFTLEVYDGGPVTLDVVDAAGRLVRRAELAASGPGSRTWTWDGRDATGRATPAGYYRVRAMGPSGGMSRGLVRVD